MLRQNRERHRLRTVRQRRMSPPPLPTHTSRPRLSRYSGQSWLTGSVTSRPPVTDRSHALRHSPSDDKHVTGGDCHRTADRQRRQWAGQERSGPGQRTGSGTSRPGRSGAGPDSEQAAASVPVGRAGAERARTADMQRRQWAGQERCGPGQRTGSGASGPGRIGTGPDAYSRTLLHEWYQHLAGPLIG